MISMQEVRGKYPQYDDMSDTQLADALHGKYYEDMPKDQFYKKVGLSSQKEPQQQEQEEQGYLKELGGDLMNTVIGAGDAVNNTVRKASNLIMPESMQMPMLNQADGLAYEGGKFLGDLGTFGAGGGALNAARGAAESIPVAGQLAKALGGQGLSGVARRAIGTGAYGALENPDDMSGNAKTGAALSAGLDLVGGTVGKILPKKYMGQVYESVANGLKGVKQESRDMYWKVMNAFGEQPITLRGINSDIFAGDSKLKKTWGKYTDNPNIENAHKLQSQIGSADRRLKGIDVATNDRKNALQESRERILDSIRRSLGSKYPQAREMYDSATKHYRENVVPYEMTNKAIRSITDPTPEKLARKMDMVTKRDAYPKNMVDEVAHPIVPKEINALGEELSNRIRNRNVAKTIGGVVTGSVIGRAVGAPLMGEILGGYLGSKSVDPLKKINSGQGEQAKQALGSMLQKIYSGMGGGNLMSDTIKTAVLR